MDENAEVPVAPSRRSATFILDTMNAILYLDTLVHKF